MHFVYPEHPDRFVSNLMGFVCLFVCFVFNKEVEHFIISSKKGTWIGPILIFKMAAKLFGYLPFSASILCFNERTSLMFIYNSRVCFPRFDSETFLFAGSIKKRGFYTYRSLKHKATVLYFIKAVMVVCPLIFLLLRSGACCS